MILDNDLVALRLRIANAESQRDAYRRSGMQDKYLEADSLVFDLTAQLERLALIAELLTSFHGRHYHYRGRRFDYLADALQYARMHRFAPGTDAPVPPASAVEIKS